MWLEISQQQDGSVCNEGITLFDGTEQCKAAPGLGIGGGKGGGAGPRGDGCDGGGEGGHGGGGGGLGG